MFKKGIFQNGRNIVPIAGLVVVAVGAGAVAATMDLRTARNTPQVQGVSIEPPAQRAAPSPLATPEVTASASEPVSKATPTPKPSASPRAGAASAALEGGVPQASMTPTPPPPTPAPIDLMLGTLTFDPFSPPIIAFTLPVTASADASVTMVVMRQDTGEALCSQTLQFSAGESQDMTCSYQRTDPPHMMNATVTAGGTVVKSSNVYSG